MISGLTNRDFGDVLRTLIQHPRWACYIYPCLYYLEHKSSAKEPEDF